MSTPRGGMSARQYFLWARDRALAYVGDDRLSATEYIDAGRAMSSMIQDLGRHPGTRGILTLDLQTLFMSEVLIGGARGARRFIDSIPVPPEEEKEKVDRLPGWPDPDARPSY